MIGQTTVMSGYQPGRRGPNVSQYIAGLNQIPQENDFTLDESYNFEDDLALFTNTEFIHNDIIDFDLDFDFTQAIPGEEEYLKQDQIQQQEEKLQQKRLQEDHSSDTNPIIQTHLHNSIHPPPSSPQPSITSITTKKQKLSTHSGKATKRAVVSASSSSSSSSSSLTVQEESPSSPTISFETSTVGAASLAPSNEEPLSISIPANDNNSTSQAGNGAMNFDGGMY